MVISFSFPYRWHITWREMKSLKPFPSRWCLYTPNNKYFTSQWFITVPPGNEYFSNFFPQSPYFLQIFLPTIKLKPMHNTRQVFLAIFVYFFLRTLTTFLIFCSFCSVLKSLKKLVKLLKPEG